MLEALELRDPELEDTELSDSVVDSELDLRLELVCGNSSLSLWGPVAVPFGFSIANLCFLLAFLSPDACLFFEGSSIIPLMNRLPSFFVLIMFLKYEIKMFSGIITQRVIFPTGN